LFEFIAYLTGLNSNPSGSSDPWVATRPSGSLAGGLGGRVVTVVSELRGPKRFVASFSAGSECELQESVAAAAGCTCFERGCCFARAAVGFVFGLRICVGVSRRLRESTTVPCSLLSVVVLPQGLKCAVCLASTFWRVFPERCLGGSGGGSPRTCLRCFCSSACCSVFPNGPCCWLFGLCMLVKVLPRIAPLLILAEVLPRSAWCSFWATVALPLWFKVCRLVGLRSGEVLPGWLLALLVEVLHRAALCCFGMSCRCCRSDCLCDNLLGCCRSRCGAFDRVSGRGASQVVFLFVFEFLDCAGGTSCVPVVGRFASLLAPYVLSQMVVWVVVMTTGKSWCDLVVPLHLLFSPTGFCP
ncbi:hypothetical protein Taro_026005, partial [Colocasia esculenta]|nr:hypothetical protein [Colocasia esculenta]